MRRILFALLFLFSGCGSFTKENKDLAELELKVGLGYLQNGANPQALASLLKAESHDPDNAAIQNHLGVAYFLRDHFIEAEKHLRRATELDDKYTDAKANLGRALIELNKVPEAIEYLKKAEEDLTYTYPEKPLINLGIAYFSIKNYSEAKQHLLKAINIQRDNCLAHDYLGRAYYESKDLNKATEALDKAIGFCQKNLFDEPQYYSGLSYYELGNKDLGVTRLEDLLKLYPNGKYRDRAVSMLLIMKK